MHGIHHYDKIQFHLKDNEYITYIIIYLSSHILILMAFYNYVQQGNMQFCK